MLSNLMPSKFEVLTDLLTLTEIQMSLRSWDCQGSKAKIFEIFLEFQENSENIHVQTLLATIPGNPTKTIPKREQSRTV